jgi:hypothetical protein
MLAANAIGTSADLFDHPQRFTDDVALSCGDYSICELNAARRTALRPRRASRSRLAADRPHHTVAANLTITIVTMLKQSRA